MNKDFEWYEAQLPASGVGSYVWPSEEGIPAGQEWEVYIDHSGTGGLIYLEKDDKKLKAFSMGGLLFGTAPLVGAIAYETLTPIIYYELSIAPHGLRMTKEEKLTSNVVFLVRARRIR